MLVHGRLQQWIFVMISLLIVIRKIQGSTGVNITYVYSGVAKGAVCLDGSPPAYHLDRGYGTGVNSWLIQLEGGGWCNNVTNCLSRKNGHLGSSKLMIKELPFSGNLNNKRRFNPDFYNWNRVKVRYCDGSSFTGDVERVDPAAKIYFRGARVFLAVIEDLLAKGMKNAENAILSGCSAGGLATIIHCDSFRALLPMGTKVKCFSDAGFFLHVKDVTGAQRIDAYFNDIVTTHGSAKNLPRSCTSKMKPSLCFFPQYMAQLVRTPLFFINSAYDAWMIKNKVAPQEADPHNVWKKCRTEIYDCTPSQLKFLQGYRQEFIKAFTGLGSSSSRGYFINSCYDHCQTELQETWLWNKQQLLANKSVAKAAGDWFFDRAPFQHIDCPYPCDKTCRSHEIVA